MREASRRAASSSRRFMFLLNSVTVRLAKQPGEGARLAEPPCQRCVTDQEVRNFIRSEIVEDTTPFCKYLANLPAVANDPTAQVRADQSQNTSVTPQFSGHRSVLLHVQSIDQRMGEPGRHKRNLHHLRGHFCTCHFTRLLQNRSRRSSPFSMFPMLVA